MTKTQYKIEWKGQWFELYRTNNGQLVFDSNEYYLPKVLFPNADRYFCEIPWENVTDCSYDQHGDKTMTRINKADLESLVAELNTRCGYATEPYTKQEDGSYKANPFNYHLDWAYGGVALDQFGASGSGVSRISRDGFDTKRKLYDFLRAFLAGMEVSK